MLELRQLMTRIRVESILVRARSTRIIDFRYYRAIRKIENRKLHAAASVVVGDGVQ